MSHPTLPSSTDRQPTVLAGARVTADGQRFARAFLPSVWYAVVPTPDELRTPDLPGYLWLEWMGKPRYVQAKHFEIRPAVPMLERDHLRPPG